MKTHINCIKCGNEYRRDFLINELCPPCRTGIKFKYLDLDDYFKKNNINIDNGESGNNRKSPKKQEIKSCL